MSITDDVRPAEQWPAEPSHGSRAGNDWRAGGADGPGGGARFDRSPPQDIGAEQSVLGGMMLSKDAIADVIEVVRSSDFYRPAHSLIFDTILDLYGRGEPADFVTVAAAMTDSGDIGRVGGAPYLHTLTTVVPTAANAAYYARIVAERAVLRRLIEAGTRIVQMGYGTLAGGRDVDDLVDMAQQAVYDVTERRVGEDFAVLADLLQPTLDEIEAVGAQSGVMTGLPTGFTDLDRLLNGLHPGQLIVVAGRPGLGKALALDTPLPTPEGWTTMAEVRAGDRLLGADGRPTTVLSATGVQVGRACYEVVFSDGTRIVADAAHRWATRTRSARRRRAAPAVRSTEQIRATLRTGAAGRANHTVDTCLPLDLPDRDLPVPPYALGVWLSRGHSSNSRIGQVDPEVIVGLEAAGLVAAPSGPRGHTLAVPGTDRVRSLTPRLRDLGLLERKRIPAGYLRAGQRQRRDLLAGLLDAGATVARSGEIRLRLASRALAADARELVVSLGYRCRMASGSLVAFHAPDDVFQVSAKQITHKRRRPAGRPRRSIVEVRRVPSVPVRCVTVDSPDHLYLAGRAMVPTHNSTAAMDFARSVSVRHNFSSAIFSLEMSKVEIVMRLLSAESRVPLHALRSGQLGDDDWTRLARRMGEISEAPLFVDDTPNMTLMEVRAKARRLKQRHDLKLVIVDYLQLMTSPKRVESRQQEVAELSRGLKLLAKEIDCPVVAVSQLNRGPEQRTDKRPQLSDLRESGCLTADTTLLRADTGAPVTFASLLRDGYDGVLVWSLDEQRRLVPAPITNVFSSGTKQVYRLTLASGRGVKATANHKFLTPGGWRELGRLAPGDRLAIPGRIPPPVAGGVERFDDEPAAPDGVVWDRVAEVEPLGTAPVFDATVKGTHNFIADGIVAHNSIEQDADVVILLHRDDYYDKESPRAGEADFIVAKHRNGPTDTVTVAAQLHVSRFVDMAVS